jgi:hypothetical protein
MTGTGWQADAEIATFAPMTVTVDFVAFDDEEDACLLVLVEQGPWTGPVEDHLSNLQDRLYGCMEAALGGHVAEQFPGAAGKKFVIRLDCYDVPPQDVDDFMERFSEGVAGLLDYSPAASPWVRSFEFEWSHDTKA